MKKSALLLTMLLVSFCYSLNVSSIIEPAQIIFTIDGPRDDPVNLTIYVWKDGAQIRANEKFNIFYPQYVTIGYETNESAVYELRVADSEGHYASSTAKITAPATEQSVQNMEQEAADAQGTNYAIVAAGIGAVMLLLLLLRFLSVKSDKK